MFGRVESLATRRRQMLDERCEWEMASQPARATLGSRATFLRGNIASKAKAPGRPAALAVPRDTTTVVGRARKSAQDTARPTYPVPPVTSHFMAYGARQLIEQVFEVRSIGISRVQSELVAQPGRVAQQDKWRSSGDSGTIRLRTCPGTRARTVTVERSRIDYRQARADVL